MPILPINTGTSANAGNGDSIRLAFHKVNQNFNFLDGLVNQTSTNFTETVQDTVSPMLVHNLHYGINSAYDDNNSRILLAVTGQLLSLDVANNARIGGGLIVGNEEYFSVSNVIRTGTERTVNLNLKNTSTGVSEIHFLDVNTGSFSIIHQNSNSSTFGLSAGQNYIFDTRGGAINIGRTGNINFFSTSTFSGYVNTSLSITPTLVSIRSTLTLSQSQFSVGGNTITVSATNLLVNGISISSGLPDRITTGSYSVVLNNTGDVILPGSHTLRYISSIPRGNTVTNYGASFNADGPFNGVGSLYFNGSSRIEVVGGSHFDLNTGSYTIEWFEKPSSQNTNTTLFNLGTLENSTLKAYTSPASILGTTATNFDIQGQMTVIGEHPFDFLNTWTHIAFVVQNTTTYRVYFNGILQVFSTFTNALPTPISTTSNLSIGAEKYFFDVINSYTGYISNMRWEAREVYTGSSFAVPTSALTATAHTRLLLLAKNANDFLIDDSGRVSETPQNFSIISNTSSLSLSANGEVVINQRNALRGRNVPGTLLRIDTDQSMHTQMSVQNYNSGTTATSDLILVRNNGNLVNQTGMIDIGINSSNYLESKFSIHSTGSAYVFSNDADLIIGTQSVGKRLKFHTDGTTTTNVAADVDTNTWTFSRNLIPSLDNNYDLGSIDKQWKNLYVGGALQTARGTHNVFTTATTATSTTIYDCSTTQLFYHSTTGTVANWTANLTNLNLVSGRATSVSIIISQGTTPYYPSALQISGVAQTLNWQGNMTPSPNADRNDVVTFNILNNGGSYLVLGQLTGF